MNKFRLALVSTGGTIEKTYDELSGLLSNDVSMLDFLLTSIVTDIEISRIRLMNKDSRNMSIKDHKLIADTVEVNSEDHDAIVIVHGTDKLVETGNEIYNRQNFSVPVILTGAMRPFQLKKTDATQNITESLLAAKILSPGVYCVMHNKVLSFPGVVKGYTLGTFVKG